MDDATALIGEVERRSRGRLTSRLAPRDLREDMSLLLFVGLFSFSRVWRDGLGGAVKRGGEVMGASVTIDWSVTSSSERRASSQVEILYSLARESAV
jgi:hypothetical protein